MNSWDGSFGVPTAQGFYTLGDEQDPQQDSIWIRGVTFFYEVGEKQLWKRRWKRKSADIEAYQVDQLKKKKKKQNPAHANSEDLCLRTPEKAVT